MVAEVLRLVKDASILHSQKVVVGIAVVISTQPFHLGTVHGIKEDIYPSSYNIDNRHLEIGRDIDTFETRSNQTCRHIRVQRETGVFANSEMM